MPSNKACCPKCGGIGGFVYMLKAIDRRVGTWDGETESAGCYFTQQEPKTVVCQDCKKRVPNPNAGTKVLPWTD